MRKGSASVTGILHISIPKNVTEDTFEDKSIGRLANDEVPSLSTTMYGLR